MGIPIPRIGNTVFQIHLSPCASRTEKWQQLSLKAETCSYETYLTSKAFGCVDITSLTNTWTGYKGTDGEHRWDVDHSVPLSWHSVRWIYSQETCLARLKTQNCPSRKVQSSICSTLPAAQLYLGKSTCNFCTITRTESGESQLK